MSWVEAIREISILIGIWVAIVGLDSWRRVHIGKRQLELAEETLALFYEAVDALHKMRYPGSFSFETDAIKQLDGETNQQWQARRKASIVFERYNHYQELFGKLHAMRYRFMAQIGKEQAKPFDDLQKVVNELNIAARRLARRWAKESFPDEKLWQKHIDEIEKYEAIFWEDEVEPDPINPKLDKIIDTIEKTCSKIIQDQGSLAAFFNRPLFRKSG